MRPIPRQLWERNTQHSIPSSLWDQEREMGISERELLYQVPLLLWPLLDGSQAPVHLCRRPLCVLPLSYLLLPFNPYSLFILSVISFLPTIQNANWDKKHSIFFHMESSCFNLKHHWATTRQQERMETEPWGKVTGVLRHRYSKGQEVLSFMAEPVWSHGNGYQDSETVLSQATSILHQHRYLIPRSMNEYKLHRRGLLDREKLLIAF